MGLLKKIFKPVSRVLDKIVPNEVKPFLPYAAAFAPMMLGPGSFMGSGIMQRALMSGGMNIGAQLAQEGNEGDINLLSAGLGALSGAMTTPEFGTKIDSLRGLGGASGDAPVGIFGGNKYVDKGLMYLDKGADFMQAPGLKKYGIPAATATGDLMFAQAKRDQDDYDRMMEEESEAEGSSNAQRAAAIRQSMESYGFSEEEIKDAIYAAGYKTGGRVGFAGGTTLRSIASGMNDGRGPITRGDYIEIYELAGYDSDVAGSLGTEHYKTGFAQDDVVRQIGFAKGGRVGFDSGGGLMDTVVGMFKKEDKGPDFGGITEAVEKIEEKPKEMLVDKLKVTIMPGQSEMRAIIEAMYNDTDGVMPDDRKNEFYELYSPQMYRNGEMDKAEFEFIQTEILGKEIPKMAEGGLMNLGGREMDMRGGGFIPIGKKERADDVPARLSKNEFVMTADAVRAAGGGSVNEGAKRMYETMNRLEARA